MKTKDRLDEIEAQLDHITNRIDNLRDELVSYNEDKNKTVEPKLEYEPVEGEKMSINEEKLEMRCKQIDRRLDELERKTESIGSITATLISNYARESCFDEPKEPLIKDEKIRKAVRAWAEVNSVEEVLYAERTDKSLFVLTGMGDDDTSIMFVGWVPTLKDGADYTIAELCGEEEE